ncbi:Homeobox protein HD-2 [Nosema granulosis]|uniref:Homeobox protein HD-2 n=1 Tax=Nosema granulosis TaxID=83296 RepID=A0A9P6KXD5_9MICR|nr:Homeobox protein HD-2 [Nosema granulosis]
MQDKRKEILEFINNIKIAETKYIEQDADRSDFTNVIKYIRCEYEKNLLKCNFGEAKYYKLFLLLFLERIKQNMIFENKLVKIVEDEVTIFCENIYNISTETMRLTETKSSPQKPEKEDMSMISTYKSQKQKSKRSNYPQKISKMLKKWLEDNVNHPYPSEAEKAQFCEKTGLDVAQINNWFINARRRILPFIKGKYTDCE